MDNQSFRDLLIYVGGGICREEDIPHRTRFTADVIEAWKQERKAFVDDMKVGLVARIPHVANPHKLTSCDRVPLGEFRSQQMLGVLRILHRFLA